MDTLATSETDFSDTAFRVINTAGTKQIHIGELGWLQGAHFVRSGPDLILIGNDGVQVGKGYWVWFTTDDTIVP